MSSFEKMNCDGNIQNMDKVDKNKQLVFVLWFANKTEK